MPRKPLARSTGRAAKRKKRKPILTASTADRHELYQEAVQCPEAELDFVERVFRRLRGRRPSLLREDFCGTAFTSCEWVKRRKENRAIGLDLDGDTLRWAREHNLSELTREQRRRLALHRRNVLNPGDARGVDAVLAMNFSWWVFHERAVLLEYFKQVRRSLARDGLFFMDIFGGWETFRTQVERRRCKGFTYVWEQEWFNSIDNRARMAIHFDFKRGPMMRRAYVYDWRVWTIAETRDVLLEAGFKNPTVYWEGDDERGGGDGVFRARTFGEDCASFVAYIVSWR